MTTHPEQPKPRYHLAYVFERFPTYTQTFCVREIVALRESGVRPLVFSIRDTGDEGCCDLGSSCREFVNVLPPEDVLIGTIKRWKDERRLPQEVVLTLRYWGGRPDKLRVYEAAYIGLAMREAGVGHAHCHFAGIAARTCWWIRQFYGITFSFTGHANDLFCDENPAGGPVDLRALFDGAAAAVTVSDFTARWLREKFPAYREKVVRVYNGLDLAPFREIPRLPIAPCEGQLPLVLSVGRLIEKKGYGILIDACAILRREGVPFRCTIVGEGPLDAQLRAQVAALDLGNHVHLAGAMPFADILALLGQTSVFALACATEPDGGMDNLPTVIMEAMAAGRPVVSTRLAGVPEMVVDSQTGLLLDEGDAPGLARAIRQLLADPARAAAMGEAGMRRARQLFDRNQTIRSLVSAIFSAALIPADPSLRQSHPDLAPALKHRWWQRTLDSLTSRRPRRDAPIIPPGAR
ncbi:glycosyltransferase family 4 protein [soil metagenome]